MDDGLAVGEGDGEAVGVGDGVATGVTGCPTGIMYKKITSGVKLRLLRSDCAPLPFHVSKPLAIKLLVKFVADPSRRIC